MSQKDNYTNVILEEVRGQYRAIQEGLDNLKEVPAKLDKIDVRLENVESDIKVIKAVIREHSADIVELKAKTAYL